MESFGNDHSVFSEKCACFILDIAIRHDAARLLQPASDMGEKFRWTHLIPSRRERPFTRGNFVEHDLVAMKSPLDWDCATIGNFLKQAVSGHWTCLKHLLPDSKVLGGYRDPEIPLVGICIT